MTFLRTKSGLSNSHAFFDVDYLVYSEGGTPSQKSNEEEKAIWSIDSIFWRSVFLRFLPSVKIRVRSLGSKEFVRPYAEKILSNSAANSIAVLDRDYDLYRGDLMDHPRVLYTHGYSWENDAWHPAFLISVLANNHPDGEISEETSREIELRYSNFLSNINRVVFVDLLCGLKKIRGLDREKYWSLIDTTDPINYKVKREKFKELITDIKTRRETPLRYLGQSRIDPGFDCYGKMIAMFCYNMLCDYYKKITECKNIPRHFADKMMAEAIINADLQRAPKLKSHYENMMSRI